VDLADPVRPVRVRRYGSGGMLCDVAAWVGVDVGGKRKGFDAAVIDESRGSGAPESLDVHAGR
jgi:hypothetical protein